MQSTMFQNAQTEHITEKVYTLQPTLNNQLVVIHSTQNSVWRKISEPRIIAITTKLEEKKNVTRLPRNTTHVVKRTPTLFKFFPLQLASFITTTNIKNGGRALTSS